jgi:hypothetical protein
VNRSSPRQIGGCVRLDIACVGAIRVAAPRQARDLAGPAEPLTVSGLPGCSGKQPTFLMPVPQRPRRVQKLQFHDGACRYDACGKLVGHQNHLHSQCRYRRCPYEISYAIKPQAAGPVRSCWSIRCRSRDGRRQPAVTSGMAGLRQARIPLAYSAARPVWLPSNQLDDPSHCAGNDPVEPGQCIVAVPGFPARNGARTGCFMIVGLGVRFSGTCGPRSWAGPPGCGGCGC